MEFTANSSMNFSRDLTTITPDNITSSDPGPRGLVGISVSFVVILLNLVGLILIYKNSELEPRTKVCIAGHAISDLILGAVYVLLGLMEFINIRLAHASCILTSCSFLALTLITGIISVLQALDQFLILRFTFSYTKWISTSKMTIIVFTIYVSCILSSLVILNGITFKNQCDLEVVINDKFSYIIILVNICICILILIPMYGYIALKTYQMMNKINEQMGNVLAVHQLRRQRQKQRRTAILLASIVGLYVACYSPMAALIAQVVFVDWNTRAEIYPNRFSRNCGIIYILNSAANPIVYIIHLRSTRNQCKTDILKCLKCCK